MVDCPEAWEGQVLPNADGDGVPDAQQPGVWDQDGVLLSLDREETDVTHRPQVAIYESKGGSPC